MNKLKNLNGPQRLGVLAILLGIIAAFIGTPNDTTSAKVNTKEIAVSSINSNDKVCVKELSDWIIKGKFDYRLIDLRNEDGYTSYNIPTSENIQMAQLLDSDLMRNEKIILYSDTDIAAAQAWFLLKAKDYKGVTILDGGLDKWKGSILNPDLKAAASADEAQYNETIISVANYFGGNPTLDGEKITSGKTVVSKPVTPAKITLKKPRGKKKREGC